MASVGYATLDIIPSLKGMQGQLERGMAAPSTAAGKASGRHLATGMASSVRSSARTVFAPLLAAGVAFKGAQFLKSTITEASDLNESLNAVNVTYGKNAAGVKALGRESAEALGLSNSEFNGLAVRFSSFSATIAGKGGDVVGTLDDLTSRASDFASVMNIDVSQAAELFQSGLAGETEPLRQFGIDMSAAKVQAFAYSEGIAKAGTELTEGQKVQARYRLLMQQTQKTQGDFGKTSGELANSQRILNARWKDAKASFGTALLPVLKEGVGFLNREGIPAFEKASDKFAKFLGQMRSGKGAGGKFVDGLHSVKDVLKDAFKEGKHLVDLFNDLPSGVKKAVLLGGGLLAARAALGGGAGSRASQRGVLGLGVGRAIKGSLVQQGSDLLVSRLLSRFTKPLPVIVMNKGFDGALGKGAAGKGKLGSLAGKVGGGLAAAGGAAAIGAGAALLVALGSYAKAVSNLAKVAEKRMPGTAKFGSRDRPLETQVLLPKFKGAGDAAAKAARQTAAYNKILNGTRVASSAAAPASRAFTEKVFQTGLAVRRSGLAASDYNRRLRSLPRGVRTQVTTPGAIKSKADVERLRTQFHLTPRQVRTLMALSGVGNAINSIRSIRLGLDAIPRVIRTQVLVNRSVSTNQIANNNDRKMATGGWVNGPGTWTSDSVPALLSNGEFVVNARSAQRHRRALEAINAQRFANGGSVGGSAAPSGGVQRIVLDTGGGVTLTGYIDSRVVGRSALNGTLARQGRS